MGLVGGGKEGVCVCGDFRNPLGDILNYSTLWACSSNASRMFLLLYQFVMRFLVCFFYGMVVVFEFFNAHPFSLGSIICLIT